MLSLTASQHRLLRPAPHGTAAGFQQHRPVVVLSQKGFSDTKPAPNAQDEGPSTSSPATGDAIDALEARIKSRRLKREAKVKVESPVMDAVTGKTPSSPGGEAETVAVFWLFVYFVVIIVEGLVIAGSGFLPEEWDGFVQDVLYPNYTPTVLGFLGFSSLYGLWKTGKLPGQEQPK